MTTTSSNGSGNEESYEFISEVTSFQHSNQHENDYTINIKLRINPNNKLLDVAFSYKPLKETLQSVISEMIDDLELNKGSHYHKIINSIEDAAEKEIAKANKNEKHKSKTNNKYKNQNPIEIESKNDNIHKKSKIKSPKTKTKTANTNEEELNLVNYKNCFGLKKDKNKNKKAFNKSNIDHLGLKNDKQILKLLQKYGDNNPYLETIIYSVKLTKINKREKSQLRIMLITNKAIYNIKPKNYVLKRRIDIRNIGSIAMSINSTEFTICVPCEYDYRYKSNNVKQQNEIINNICNLYEIMAQKRLIIHKISAISTIDYTVNKSVAKSREKALHRKRSSGMELEKLKKQNEISPKLQTDLLIFGYIRTNIENIFSIFIPEEVIINIIMYYFNKITMNDFIFKQCIGKGRFSLLYKVEKKYWNQKQKIKQSNKNKNQKYFVMQIYFKEQLKERNNIDCIINRRKIFDEIGSHPFIKELFYAFQTNNKLIFVYNYFYGGELFQYLKKHEKFKQSIVKIWIAEISLAVGYLHKFNIFYISLKPENILLCQNGHCYLSNIDCVQTQKKNDIASPMEYLSPEVVYGQTVDKNVDWWTIGVLMYELLIGKSPFYSEKYDEMCRKIIKAPLVFPKEFSNEMKDIISNLLIRDVSKRLGFNNDIHDIMEHVFFNGLDWNKLMRKEIKSLFVVDTEVQLRNDWGYNDVVDIEHGFCYDDQLFKAFTCFPS